MTIVYYRCHGCKQDVSELDVWTEYNGDFCPDCIFKNNQKDYNYFKEEKYGRKI